METPPLVFADTAREENPTGENTPPVIDDSGDWKAAGKCRDLPPEVFFPADGVGVEIAKRICEDCLIKEVCLEFALYNGEKYGVWGGTSERERRKLARRRRG